MEHDSHEPQPSTLTPTPTIRHDGWTGDKMASFLETLAETAVVAEACDQARMGISSAYALRCRNPAFAAAWDAALTIARERLADTLLARSMEGNVEQLYKDGELIGERHLLDNRPRHPPPPRSAGRRRHLRQRATCPSPATTAARDCTAEASTGNRRSKVCGPATMPPWRMP
jgi:hypothetical protein